MNSSPEIVKFNIGGQIFTTTKSTIKINIPTQCFQN